MRTSSFKAKNSPGVHIILWKSRNLPWCLQCQKILYTAIWTCQHSTSGFKNHLNSKTRMPSCVTKQKSIVPCLLAFEGKMVCLWVSKIKSWIKGYHHYNYKYTIGEKTVCLRESENQHIEFYFSLFKENQPKTKKLNNNQQLKN